MYMKTWFDRFKLMIVLSDVLFLRWSHAL